MPAVVLLVVAAILGCLYLPDLLTNKNRLGAKARVEAVVKTGGQAVKAVANAVANNYTEPVVPPDPVEVQTAAIEKAAEALTKMPEAIAKGVADASAKQLEQVNRRLAQQDAANARTAEVAQATIGTLGKVVDRLDKLDATVKELKDERTKVTSSPKEEAKPSAETEEPEAKEEKSSSEGSKVSSAPVKQIAGTGIVIGVDTGLRSESGAIITAPPPNNIIPKIVREEYEAQQRSSRTGRR